MPYGYSQYISVESQNLGNFEVFNIVSYIKN